MMSHSALSVHACVSPPPLFFSQLQDSHVLLLRQLFWFTIDHMVHSSCLKNTEKPGRSLAVTDKVSGRELAGKVLSDITFAHYAN